MTESTFLPLDMKPEALVSQYTKLGPGETRIRILTKPVGGWRGWLTIDEQRKPVTYKTADREKMPKDAKDIAMFWAMKIWNYRTEQVEIFVVSKKSIQQALWALVEDKDWGDFTKYDIKITKTGEMKETRYKVLPCPKKELDETIVMEDSMCEVKLENLYSTEANPYGGNPFVNGK